MLRWAIIFLVIAFIAGVSGFDSMASDASGIARIHFFIFPVLLLIFVIRTGEVLYKLCFQSQIVNKSFLQLIHGYEKVFFYNNYH